MIYKLFKLRRSLHQSGFSVKANRIENIIRLHANINEIPTGSDWTDFARWIYRNKRDRMRIDTRNSVNIQMSEISKKLKSEWNNYKTLYKEWYNKYKKENDYTSDGVLTSDEVLDISEKMNQSNTGAGPYSIQQTFNFSKKND